MPNHVTTRLIVAGSETEIERFVKTHIIKDALDFGTIIEVPAAIRATGDCASGDVEMALVALRGVTEQTVPNMFSPRTFAEYVSSYGHGRFGAARTQKELLKWFEEKRPEVLELAKLSAKAIDETGHKSWYEWQTACWGTKWNAYDWEVKARTPNRLEATFDTAWSFPEPIFKKLATLFPDLVFVTVSFDEGWNFASSGIFAGRVVDYTPGEADEQMHLLVYGRPPKGEDEGEGEEP